MLLATGLVSLTALVPPLLALQSPETQSEGMPAGMQVYRLGFLERGPRTGSVQGEEAKRLLDAHHAHLQQSFDAGSLVASGPIAGDGDLRGVVILAGASLAGAAAVAEADPAVQAGTLAVKMLSWWGPEGIGDAYRARLQAKPDAEDEMVEYQLGLLLRGPESGAGSAEQRERIQGEHLAYLAEMRESGAMVAAGPFEGDGDLRGLVIYRVDSLDAARSMAQADPAVRAGRLEVEMLGWWVAEGVMPE